MKKKRNERKKKKKVKKHTRKKVNEKKNSTENFINKNEALMKKRNVMMAVKDEMWGYRREEKNQMYEKQIWKKKIK